MRIRQHRGAARHLRLSAIHRGHLPAALCKAALDALDLEADERPVEEGESIDRALKRYKRKFDKTGTLKQLRKRQAFIKPSIKQREEKLHAAYVQQLRSQEEA